MHKIHEKEFTLEDFSTEHLLGFDGPHNDEREIPYVPIDHNDISPLGLYKCGIIPMLNLCREKYLEIDRDIKLEREKALNMNSSEPMVDIKKLKEKQKDIWWQMIQLLPSSYNQTRNVMLNYEVLANIYKSRKNHKLDCWRDFCAWAETLPYSELITNCKPTFKEKLNKIFDRLKKDVNERSTMCDTSDIECWLDEEWEEVFGKMED